MKTIFEMMSLHCVPYILYWIQAEWKFYIQTYCQIIWVNFTNMVAIIFFPSGRQHLANHPPPPVRICPLLPDPHPLHPPYVLTSFMDGAILQHWCFPMKYVKFLRTPILKNMYERLLLFVSPQNTITISGGEFGLDETSTECILFNQMQLYNLYVS